MQVMVNGRCWGWGAWLGLFAVGACSGKPSGPGIGGAAAGHENAAQAGADATANGGRVGGAGGKGGSGGAGIGGAASAATAGGGLDWSNLGADGENAGAAGASSCELGEVSSTGTNQNLDLFGNIVYFADGIELPAGRYRITYLDGCMKYSAAQDWALHAYAGAEPDGWWFVGNDQTQKVVVPPGTVGFLASSGGFTSFDQCVAANLALAPVEFAFAGGKLGAWLQDSPYTDNQAGESNRNPKWKLTLLGDCDLVEWPK